MATDPTTIPSVADLQETKQYMNNINEFVVSEQDAFTDNTGSTRKTLTGIESKADTVINNIQSYGNSQLNTILTGIQSEGDTAIAEKSDEFDLTLDQYKESRGFNTKGTFVNGFTYELPNDVGLDASGNPWILIDTNSLPVTVTAGTTPTNPPYKQVGFGTAAQVSTNTSDTVQSFIDSFALKIFQSHTEGGLTEIQTRTVDAGEVYEVRKTSDDSLATIYSDAAGTTEIVQNGTSNVSDSDGVVEFYIADTAEKLKIEVGTDASIFSNEPYLNRNQSINFNSVSDMVSDCPVGSYCSTGFTSWKRVGNSGDITDFTPENEIMLADFESRGDWSDTISKVISISKANGFDVVKISDETYNVETRPEFASSITFEGDGVFTGGGAYRFRVINSKTGVVSPKPTISPSQLTNFSKAIDPVVVICGDSLTTVQPDSLDQTSTLANVFKTKLQSDNPEKNITYLNRGIGGQTFKTFNDVPTVFPTEWYNDAGKPWIDYIEDLEPDLVIIGFGMNDGQNDGFSMASATSAINKIKAFSKPCDIIFVTTPVPTLDATGIHSDYSTVESQEGRDRAAGFVRSYAEYYGHGYIDANRMSGIARDGFDVTESVKERTSTTMTSGAAIANLEGTDFSMQLRCSDSAFTTDGRTLSVKLGPDRLDVVIITDNSGFLKFQFYAGGLYKTVTSSLTTPTGDWNLLVEKKGNRFYASKSGSTNVDDVVSELIVCGGGVFNASVGWFQTDYNSGPISYSFFTNVGTYKRCIPSSNDYELWGQHIDGNTSLKLPYGGNGLNHPSSIGVSRFYQDALANCNTSVVTRVVDSFNKYSEIIAVPTGSPTAVDVFDGTTYTFKKTAVYNITSILKSTGTISGSRITLRSGDGSSEGPRLIVGDTKDEVYQLTLNITRRFIAGSSVTIWIEHETGVTVNLTNIYTNVIEV